MTLNIYKVMSLIILLACVFVSANALSPKYIENTMKSFADYAEKCMPESGASDEDIAELLEHKPLSRREGKCLIACFLRELGLFVDGKPNKESTIARMAPLKDEDPETYVKVMQIFEKCHHAVGVVEEDVCELASKLADCSQKMAVEDGIDPQALLG